MLSVLTNRDKSSTAVKRYSHARGLRKVGEKYTLIVHFNSTQRSAD